jgi:hypothetical protein
VIADRHRPGEHWYSIPRTVLEADALISVPKLKTHRKAGVTLTLKNLVGLTNEKRWLPHHRYGSPEKGGDMFPDGTPFDRRLSQWLQDRFLKNRYGRLGLEYVYPMARSLHRLLFGKKRVETLRRSSTSHFADGDWYGNDTIWRTVLDLNMILLYADREGNMQPDPQRKFLGVIDGILAGDGEGPLHPDPKRVGILIAGTEPVANDWVAAFLMGFDPKRIPNIREAFQGWTYPLASYNAADIQVVSNEASWGKLLQTGIPHLEFEPTRGWKGRLERGRAGLSQT